MIVEAGRIGQSTPVSGIKVPRVSVTTSTGVMDRDTPFSWPTRCAMRPSAAKRIAKHSKVKTTELYDRRGDEVSFSEIERWGFK